MQTLETVLEVNRLARRNRHLRVFSKGGLLRVRLSFFISAISKPIIGILQVPVLQKIGRFLSSLVVFFENILPISPQKRLLFQATVIGLAGISVTSFSQSGTFTTASLSYSTDYMQAYALPGDILVSDEDGYLVKINPQTNDSNRIGLTDFAVHSVESGETLSVVAQNYGVKVQTIMWENGISNANSLRVGQMLLIPPVDGISYKVNSGDNLEKIAKKYSISAESIIAQNGLGTDTLRKGQSLFLPGAKPLFDPINVATVRNPSSSRSTRIGNLQGSSDSPSVGKIFIYPTKGKVTQGFHGGHYAIDIADRSKPPVWAAGGGTVVKASSGTWGGGYGNHVIIDHGNGIQTLYGHLDSVNVEVGQTVSQGDVVGVMGNTGRVYGVTGIHLHFEVRDNGVKKNPWNYM